MRRCDDERRRMMAEPSSKVRSVVSLNILHGGGTRADALTERLLNYEADALVVTEFRASRIGERLLARLEDAGYVTSHPDSWSPDSVLITSRTSIDRSWAFNDELDARRLWCADIGWIVVCGVVMPSGQAKLPFWNSLVVRDPAVGSTCSLATSTRAVANWTKSPKPIDSRAGTSGGRCTPVFGVREYSYVSNTDNGFRVDHAFAAPELAQRVTACELDHAPRLLGEPDHSALIVRVTTLAPSSVRGTHGSRA